MTVHERLRALNPLWWRLPMWALFTAASVVQAHGRDDRIATGVLMAVAAVTLQFVRAEPVTVRRTAVVVTTVAGLAACATAPEGLAYLLVVVAAARAPHSFEARPLTAFTVLDALAFGITVGVVSHSYAGLLAGFGVPALVQRTAEHLELIRERDRATALLAEVQRGRESEARAAALQERSRIARDMHDVLAHSLAGLSVQLQAVRAVAAREQVGPAVLEPLDTAASLAREGLAEARAAVGTLRDPAGLALDALPALVARHPGDVTLRVDGPPGAVTPEAGHAVHRAVQESLTNAARYAPGGSVRVTLSWRPDLLTATVLDTGPAAGRDPVTGAGSGLGLAGMGERVSATGGTVHAGPDGAGWCVEVQVPAVAVPVEVGP